MYERHDPSSGAKLVLVGMNGAGVCLAAVLLFAVFRADLVRSILIVGCSLVYFLRIIGTTFVLGRRQVRYGEAFGVGVWIIIIHATMATAAGLNPSSLGWVAWVGVLLYVCGSMINTGAEYLRKRWKDDPANAGKLYTGGFFRYAVHINYFGDVVLFIGFALVTGNAWAFIIPALMTCLFVFGNIPMLDKHLAEHYGPAFDDYAGRTAKFVPFVY